MPKSKKPLVAHDRRPTRKVGRPSLFQTPIVEKLIKNIRVGMKYHDACAASGISYDTFRAWMRTAENILKEHQIQLPTRGQEFHIPEELIGDGNPYVQFFNKVHEAAYSGLAQNLHIIQSAGRGKPILDEDGKIIGYENGDWRAAEALIKMRFPQYNKQVQELSGPEGGPIQTQSIPADPVLIAKVCYKKSREAGLSHKETMEKLRGLGFEETDLEGLGE